MNDKDRNLLIRYWRGKYDDVVEEPIIVDSKAPVQSLKNSPLLDKIDSLLKHKKKEIEDDSDWT
jgi:hypothetical protein